MVNRVRELEPLETILRANMRELLVVRKSGVRMTTFPGACCNAKYDSPRSCELLFTLPIGIPKQRKDGTIVIFANNFVSFNFEMYASTAKLKDSLLLTGNLELPSDFYFRDEYEYRDGGVVTDDNVRSFFLQMARSHNRSIPTWFADRQYFNSQSEEKKYNSFYLIYRELLDI